jgi:glycosyltransferase involved in cell wall biosynthesis
VTVLGPLSQADFASRLTAADCLVLPSRNESFGMVVPEALAAGLPVLVSDRAGAAALVQEGRNGWIVPAGDAGALAGRMLRAAGSREELGRMREDCRRSAAACGWSAYGERLSSLLRALLGGQASP